MATVDPPRVSDYLSQLDRALRGLPRARREEIVRDIRFHIDAALAETPEPSPAAVESVLDDLGTPEEIAAAALVEMPPTHRRLGMREILTVLLLLVGGLVVPVVGWCVGWVLLLTSDAWRTRDKIIGTVLVPGGLLAPFAIFVLGLFATTGESCTSESTSVTSAVDTCNGAGGSSSWSLVVPIAIAAVTVLGPVFTTAWLIRTARRHPTAGDPAQLPAPA